ncbi:MAG: polysaccharide biosynthesis tyrosine autokinase [Ardenticatenaceae bacterium]|nr:polysaccharide biosynthesis tyrosine autokinase [Ardenticatenaceae bacterium]HBY97264.1 protein tyrosine kinase [Chloroflexota bacterium]
MELRQYARIVWKWLWLIVICTAVSGAIAYVVSINTAPVYQATASLLIREGKDPESTTYTDLLTSERLARTYSERLQSRPVLEETARALGLQQDLGTLKVKITVQPVRDTQLIRLTVEHTDPALAQAIANTIPQVFANRNAEQQSERFAASKESLQRQLDTLAGDIEDAQGRLTRERAANPRNEDEIDRLESRVTQLRNTQSSLVQSFEQVRLAEATSLNSIIVDEPAALPTKPVRPRPLTNTLLAAVVGAMIGLGTAFLIEYLDERVRDPAMVESLVGLPILGQITELPHEHSTPAQAVILANAPRSPLAEAYRMLRTNLQFAMVDRPLHILVVTSPGPREGKSVTSANLAVAVAQTGARVILVDADLRRPSQHTLFTLPNQTGLTSAIVSDEVDLQALLKPTTMSGLSVMTSGPIPPNPAELLNSERMSHLLQELAAQAELVILDTPPTLAATDAAILAAKADGTLLVIDTNLTKRTELVHTTEQLQRVGATLLGATLNRLRRHNLAGYYYYYYDVSSDHNESGPAPAQRRKRKGFLGSARHTAE